MCSMSNKILKNSVWHFSRIRYVPIVNRLCTVATASSDQQDDKLLTKEKARILIMNFTIEERDNLAWCLNNLESEEIKAEYQGSITIYVMFETVCVDSYYSIFTILLLFLFDSYICIIVFKIL